MNKRITQVSAIFAVAMLAALAQAPPTPEAKSGAPAIPAFEVVSIKPCGKDGPGRMRSVGSASPGRLNTGCDLLADDNSLGLIQRAYAGSSGGQSRSLLDVLPITGGPPWIHSEMYSIDAKIEGQPSKEMMQGPMLQAVLEDRFKLQIHRETREGPVYLLTLANKNSKLKRFKEGSCIQVPNIRPAPIPPSGQRYCNMLISFAGSIEAEGSTLTEFSKLLKLTVDRPVIDKTGLSGRFDIHLDFSRDEITPGLREPPPDAPDPNTPTILTALPEQLGLKLTPAKGPVEVLVIDHVERPSAN